MEVRDLSHPPPSACTAGAETSYSSLSCLFDHLAGFALGAFFLLVTTTTPFNSIKSNRSWSACCMSPWLRLWCLLFWMSPLGSGACATALSIFPERVHCSSCDSDLSACGFVSFSFFRTCMPAWSRHLQGDFRAGRHFRALVRKASSEKIFSSCDALRPRAILPLLLMLLRPAWDSGRQCSGQHSLPICPLQTAQGRVMPWVAMACHTTKQLERLGFAAWF